MVTHMHIKLMNTFGNWLIVMILWSISVSFYVNGSGTTALMIQNIHVLVQLMGPRQSAGLLDWNYTFQLRPMARPACTKLPALQQ